MHSAFQTAGNNMDFVEIAGYFLAAYAAGFGSGLLYKMLWNATHSALS